MKALKILESYWRSWSELKRLPFVERIRAFGKLLYARVRHQFGPEQFFLNDLHNRPVGSYGDYRKLYMRFGSVLRIVNDHSLDPDIRGDKVAQDGRLQMLSVPVAPILAVAFRNSTIGCPGNTSPLLQSDEAVLAFLHDADTPDQLFFKPAGQDRGNGIFAATRFGREWTIDGQAVRPTDIIARLHSAADMVSRAPREHGSAGVVIQRRLKSADQLAPVGGEFGLTTIRVNTVRTVNGGVAYSAAAKLFTQHGLIDNFLGGATGNLIAGIDIDRGVFGPAYGRRPCDRLLLTRYDRHPATGEAITGRRIDGFEAVIDVAQRAVDAFPAIALCAFDVALTNDGAMVIERNVYWDPVLPQLALNGGIAPVLKPLWPILAVTEDKRKRSADILFD